MPSTSVDGSEGRARLREPGGGFRRQVGLNCARRGRHEQPIIDGVAPRPKRRKLAIPPLGECWVWDGRSLMKITVRWRWVAGLLLVVLAWPALGIGSAVASPVDGTWIIDDLGLDLFDCQSRVCGRIVWIKDPNRRQSQCGQTIIWGLAAAGPSEWTGGSILDPDDSTTYQLSAKLQPDGALRARIYEGIQLLGRTKILTRIDLGSLAGRC